MSAIQNTDIGRNDLIFYLSLYDLYATFRTLTLLLAFLYGDSGFYFVICQIYVTSGAIIGFNQNYQRWKMDGVFISYVLFCTVAMCNKFTKKVL